MSIDRESKLSGQIHDKGFLTLRGYLEQRYGDSLPLSLSASLTFEQSYGGLEGDSASSGELYALLSSLADAPIDQGIAVTGSVDQYGRIQAVGGVTEKVEGFFAACERAGLNGEQGVIVPAANRRHLMLDEHVVAAVREGRFHVWAVESVDQGIEILTGAPAGERSSDGAYPAGHPASAHPGPAVRDGASRARMEPPLSSTASIGLTCPTRIKVRATIGRRCRPLARSGRTRRCMGESCVEMTHDADGRRSLSRGRPAERIASVGAPPVVTHERSSDSSRWAGHGVHARTSLPCSMRSSY